MSIKFLNSKIHILNMTARMPFKYGITTLTSLPHLFLEIELDIDGVKSSGISADGLAPKWFTKNPQTSFQEDIEEMILVINKAVELSEEIQSAETVFDFWQQIYTKQEKWGKKEGLPSLLTSFGTSMVERAMISAFCKARQAPFHKSIKALGFKLSKIYPELSDSLIDQTLPQAPKNNLEIRHTVGLADYLSEEKIPSEEKVNDGLPQSFNENIKAYGIQKLKIKVFGDLEKDIPRLRKISAIMDSLEKDFKFSLDGNEFFKSAEQFKSYWLKLTAEGSIKSLLNKLLFVEQPIHRGFALNKESGECFLKWPDRPKIIIDESDGDLKSAQKALELGYSGTSHKNCKGIFKSIANACLVKKHAGILSAEDLCNVGPVALLQDLAVVSALGISHVERNGHQYMQGLSMFPNDIQQMVLNSHADLYKTHNSYPTVNINNGLIDIESLNNAPLGLKGDIDTSNFTPLESWQYTDLNLS